MPDPTRVLIVCPHLDNSMRLLADLLRHLDPRFQITLFVLENGVRLLNEFPPDSRKIILENGIKKSAVPGTFFKLLKEAKQHDLIVGYAELSPTYLASAAAMLAGKPCIGWVHAHLSRIFDLGQRPGRLHRAAMRLFYNRLDAVVGVSDGVTADLIHNFGLSQAVSIVNGIDLDRVRALADLPIPENLAPFFNGDLPVVVSVAALHYQKNPHLLIDAHQRLIQQGVKHRLIIVGDGPMCSEIEQLIQDRHLADTLTLAGYQTNPYPLVKHATAFALTSRWEGYALVLAEALALGTPPVSTDVSSGPREILGDNRYGLLVPEGDVTAFTDALKTLLTDQSVRNNFQQLADEGAQKTDIKTRSRQMADLIIRLTHPPAA